MSPFLQILIVGVGTYLFRVSAIALLSNGRSLPAGVEDVLRLIAPAVLAGLVANSLLLTEGGWRAPGAWHIAAAVAAVVSIWRRSVGLTLAAGMGALWLMGAVGA